MADRKVKLSRPLKTHGGDINELTLREPRARDFIAMRRLPFSVVFKTEGRKVDDPTAVQERSAEMTTDYESVLKWVERLSGIEMMILEHLPGVDVAEVTQALRELVGEADTDQTKPKNVDDQVKNSSASSQT